MLDATALAEGTTTDTTNGAILYSAVSPIGGSQIALLVPFQVHVKHSAVSAIVTVTLELYNGPTISDTPAFTVWGTKEQLSPTANEWRLISQTAVVLFSPPSWSPGQRLFQVRATPVTAGTLTYGSDGALANDSISIFQLGAIDQ